MRSNDLRTIEFYRTFLFQPININTMKNVLISFLLSLINSVGFSQDEITLELKTLSQNGQYEKVIKHASKSSDYSAKALYYIGQAFYMIEDDVNCLKFMDMSIAKDATDPAPYFIKGSTLNYINKYDDAIKSFQLAINLYPEDAAFYSGIGDSYYMQEKFDLALEWYIKATEHNFCPDRPYSMVAQIYVDQEQNEKALEAFYIAKSKISTETDSYINALYNIGLLESLAGNYDKAEPSFLELLEIKPNDYHTFSKLIQIYFHRMDYDKAKVYRDKLYEAQKQGKLEGTLNDKFCFEQFEWNDYLVQAYERYESGDKQDIYNKHIFYLKNKNDEIVLTVQTEYSPFSVELGGSKYLLCANKKGSHFNPGIGFNDDLKYEDLKKAAIKLFERYMK